MPPDRPLKLILIDDDSVFRQGLKLWLDRFADLKVIAEADSGAAALQILQSTSVDLIILDLALGRADRTQTQGLALCQQLADRYPQPILLLSSFTEPVMQAAAQQAGSTGYCLKNLNVDELSIAIRQVAAGQSYWMQPSQSTDRAPSPRFASLRRSLQQSGTSRIDAALADIAAQLQNPNLSLLDRAVLVGRRRELRASRWLVDRLSPTSAAVAPDPLAAPLPAPESTSALAVIEPLSITARTLQTVLWDRVLAKLHSLQNQTDLPLETDILWEDKKRELFYLVLKKLEELLDELRFSQIQPPQLVEKKLLQDLWQATIADFYGKYSIVQINQQPQEVVETLLQEADLVRTAILDRIPFAIDLISHLLFQTPLMIDGVSYAAGSPEALARSEILLENLVIQTANGAVQPLLNRFANVAAIQQNFYDYRLISVREIERFRNNLSWKYRLDQYVNEPKAIFESQYRLLVFSGRGIYKTAIYAPRDRELEQLTGIQLSVTLALETRDAIAPRLRAAVSFVGSGVIYLLTEVVGRSLGLIGRGILKGIGGAWQDARVGRNGERQK